MVDSSNFKAFADEKLRRILSYFIFLYFVGKGDNAGGKFSPFQRSEQRKDRPNLRRESNQKENINEINITGGTRNNDIPARSLFCLYVLFIQYVCFLYKQNAIYMSVYGGVN